MRVCYVLIPLLVAGCASTGTSQDPQPNKRAIEHAPTEDKLAQEMRSLCDHKAWISLYRIERDDAALDAHDSTSLWIGTCTAENDFCTHIDPELGKEYRRYQNELKTIRMKFRIRRMIGRDICYVSREEGVDPSQCSAYESLPARKLAAQELRALWWCRAGFLHEEEATDGTVQALRELEEHLKRFH